MTQIDARTLLRIEEASRIKNLIEQHIPVAANAGASIVLNLGSGLRNFREQNKPHIDRLTLQALRAKGYNIIHSDLITGEGVDLSGDLFNPTFFSQLCRLKPNVVLFCNILEHISAPQRKTIPALLSQLLSHGGFLIVSVPRSYPYHGDPIDTMYRPTEGELRQAFSSFECVDSDTVSCGTYGQEFMQGDLLRRLKKILRLFAPFVRPKRWLSHAHRFFWLWRPYKINVVLFRK